ncbi:MAG: hypothetical protein Ta2G_18620 [Termitinemataceae bacterium]|nr:MAG: hypothetical protein Ta2G_18620 [Termitinemataceae bacterium]
MKIRRTILFITIVFLSGSLYAYELFPEAAEKNSLFFNVKAIGISFTKGFLLKQQEAGIDYVLPIFIPLSLGAYFRVPDPNLKVFGLRLAYHVNVDVEDLDLYAFYVFDFGFLRNNLLRKYGDEEQEIHYYDFRFGVRYLAGKYFCLMLETDFKLKGLNIGVAVKIF